MNEGKERRKDGRYRRWRRENGREKEMNGGREAGKNDG